eukprot:5796310-Karenia_brevis.AAC.1
MAINYNDGKWLNLQSNAADGTQATLYFEKDASDKTRRLRVCAKKLCRELQNQTGKRFFFDDETGV